MVYGWGILDVDYPVTKHIDGKQHMDEIYGVWRDMIYRCTSKKERLRNYWDCSVCEEWRYFSNFKDWCEKQDYKGMSLDKDLKIPGNKVYSPEACMFVPQRINCSVLLSEGSRGDLPLGVRRMKRYDKLGYGKPYSSQGSVREGGKSKFVHLGYSFDPMECHRWWQSFKIDQMIKLYNEEKDKPWGIYLLRCVDNLFEDICLGRETKEILR